MLIIFIFIRFKNNKIEYENINEVRRDGYQIGRTCKHDRAHA